MSTSLFYFPNSAYLQAKWWHRLALVVQWGFLCFIAFALFMIVPHEYYSSGTEKVMSMAIWATFAFLPTIVYRALLFIFTGDSWKDSNE